MAIRTHLRTVGIVLGTVLAVSATPAAARTIVDFARNAGHVDGLNAVGFVTCPKQPPVGPPAACPARSHVLVATNQHGYLPNDIIQQATDSARLGGLAANRFAQMCSDGSVAGFAQVPGDTPSTWTTVDGYGHSLLVGGPFPGLFLCTRFEPKARQTSPGVYLLDLHQGCFGSGGGPNGTIPAVVTVTSTQELVPTYTTVCVGAQNRKRLEERVLIRTPDGTPASADFTIAELEPARVDVP